MGPEQLPPAGPGQTPPQHQVHGAGAQQGVAGIQEQDPHRGPQADVRGGHAGRPPQEGESGAADGVGGRRCVGQHQTGLNSETVSCAHSGASPGRGH